MTTEQQMRRRELMREVGRSNVKHGLAKTYIFVCWQQMIQRCYNPKLRAYPHYGGRGIRVCEFLRVSPTNLLRLLGERETSKHSVDRINNAGHYTCGKCAECFRCGYPMNLRWATVKEQARNRRSNRIVELRGEERCLSEWADIIGISVNLLSYRLAKGVDPFKPKEHRKPFDLWR